MCGTGINSMILLDPTWMVAPEYNGSEPINF